MGGENPYINQQQLWAEDFKVEPQLGPLSLGEEGVASVECQAFHTSLHNVLSGGSLELSLQRSKPPLTGVTGFPEVMQSHGEMGQGGGA